MRCQVLADAGWCSTCYAKRRGREGGHSPRRPLPDSEVTPFTECEMAMKRPDMTEAGGLRSSALDEVLRGWLPDLHDRLTETAWDDGKPRKTDSLMIVTENGRWKAWLHDRDGKRGAWVSAESYEGLLETMNKAIAAGSLEWRRDTR